MLKIRLRRTGARKKPSYRIVVAESTAPRDGKYVEIIGTYDPLTDPSTIKLDGDRAKHWLSVGAQPTERVYKLMAREGLVEAPTYRTPASTGSDGAATVDAAPAAATSAPAPAATHEAAPAAEPEPVATAEAATDDDTETDVATAESAAASSAVDDDAESAAPAPKRARARTPKAKADTATEERAPVEADAE